MENETRFSLDENIQRWRSQFIRAGAIAREDLEELESHLRDSIADLTKTGLTQEEAFFVGARRLGQSESLDSEFGKVHGERVWRKRAALLLFAIQAWSILSSFLGAPLALVLEPLLSLLTVPGSYPGPTINTPQTILAVFASLGFRLLVFFFSIALVIRWFSRRELSLESWICRLAEHRWMAACILIVSSVLINALPLWLAMLQGQRIMTTGIYWANILPHALAVPLLFAWLIKPSRPRPAAYA